MDGIQTYKGSAATPNSIRPGPAALTANPAAVKTASSYFKALRRRFWMVLAIAVPLAISSSIVVLRLTPIYLVKAEIEINPPEVPPQLSTLVSHDLGRRDPASHASYVPNQEVRLRSKWLADLVVNNSAIAAELSQYADPAVELFKSLTVVSAKKGTNSFIVSLEGPDPARTKRLLEMLLIEFQYQAKQENENKLNAAKVFAETNLRKLVVNLDILDKKIGGLLKDTPMIGPHGRSIIEEQYVNFGSMLSQKRLNMDALQQHVLTSQLLPRIEFDSASSGRAAKIAQLEEQIQMLALHLEHIKGISRNFNADPSAIMLAQRLGLLLDKRDKLLSARTEVASSPIETIMERFRQEIEADQDTQNKLLTKMQESMPDYQKFLAMLNDRADKKKQIVAMEDKLTAYEIVEKAIVTNECVKIPPSVVEPTVPIKPNRAMLIVLGLFVSFGLGIGLVCMLEHVDHSVTVPEHVTHGLTLSLLGVVPRIRRTALTHRGGHLWTPATPDSLEADAYRNIRASLLGIADRRGPIITLLVTSAKAGEGKSTTAINLAATCARAGERTLLMDIDLRRPSLAEVFIEDESTGDVHGLIDVLRGDLPWQRTVRHTEIPNLDFIPTGDTRSIPIEILGTRELRQLLIGLSHHYDRVILDGPAVLGLADCRVLGRIVDASLLVVRSGSHQLMTLHRAKAMLEQSHVVIAGVVFNGLTDDMNNWSSYGYDPLPVLGGRLELVTSH
jgi:capsular exopolysaccharide synthesis family protein